MKVLHLRCPKCTSSRVVRVDGEATVSMDCEMCFLPEGGHVALVDCTREEAIAERLGGSGNIPNANMVAVELAALERRLEAIEVEERRRLGQPLEEVT